MEYNTFDQAIMNKKIYDNPYLIYEKLRAEEPICWSTIKQAWIVSKHSYIKTLLESSNVTTKRVSIQNQYLEYDDYLLFNRFFSSWLMYKDGVEHFRIKKETRKIFTNSNYLLLNGIGEVAEKIIEQKSLSKRIDFVKEYAEIIAVKSMYNFFNVPSDHHDSFFNWSKYIINFMQGRTNSENLLDIVGSTKIAISNLQNTVEKIYIGKNIYNNLLPTDE